MKKIDLRSDTTTYPTGEMRKAMYESVVGDDVYGEDPTINELEATASAMLGKEAGLFVASGTMGNQIAVMANTNPGDEIITESSNHIFLYEVGGLARLCGVQTNIIKGERGYFGVDELKQAIRAENIHYPVTKLVSFENTHNRAGGRVFKPSDFAEHIAICREEKIICHLDGARIFNASVALNINVKELCADFDTVTFCLSKGLGAPVGSVLVGNQDFINRARKYRKLLGGGMRQGGVLAACGLIALDNMIDRLAEDHDNAKELALTLDELPHFALSYPVESNIIVLNYLGELKVEDLVVKLKENGILVNPFGEQAIRLVTHKDLPDDFIAQTVAVLSKLNLA